MLKSAGVLPGFGLSLGYTVFYLSLVVLIPLSTLFAKSATRSARRGGEVVNVPAPRKVRCQACGAAGRP
jgi:sulfate transport system permease protein